MENIQMLSPKATLPSAFKLLGGALSFYKAHWPTLVGVMAIPFVIGTFQLWGGVEIIVGLLTLLFAFLSVGALITVMAAKGTPEKGVVGAYENAIRLLTSYGWISILTTLAVLGGFVLFVIPGLVLSLWLTFAPYILFTENKKGLSALTASYAYIKGYWWSVVWRIVFLGVLSILIQTGLTTLATSAIHSAQPKIPQFFQLMVIHFFLIPVSIAYAYGIYQAVREMKAQHPLEVNEAKFRTVIKVFIALGIVGIFALLAFVGLIVSFLARSSAF
ncbi:MAG: hypothetical protein Q8P03_01430 [bacterium]|nr:hypothetical protein [bacterium]